MNARRFQAWSEWLKRHPARRIGKTVAVAAASICATAALPAAAAGDEATPASGQSEVGTQIRDATVTAKVKAALFGKEDLSSRDIHVTTNRGNVLLTGSVPDVHQRQLAVSTAKQIEGVQGVQDQLTIRPN